MKDWLKGGLIGGVVAIFLIFLNNYIYKLLSGLSLIFVFKILYFPRTIIYSIIYSEMFNGIFYKASIALPMNTSSSELTVMGIVISLIFIFLFYFIIGAIIGLIINKVKQKKKVVNE